MKNNKFYDYEKLNKLMKNVYAVNLTISIDKKLSLIKDYFNKLYINSDVFCDTDGIYIILQNIYGDINLLIFPLEISASKIYSNSLEFISKNGGLRKWQIQIN